MKKILIIFLSRNKYLYEFIRMIYRFFKRYIVLIFYYLLTIFHQKQVLRIKKKISQKQKIRVGFFLICESIWKYDYLYLLFMQSEIFEPIIYICPNITKPIKIYEDEMSALYNKMTSKGYNCVNTRVSQMKYLDISKEDLSIIFFTSPWKLTLKNYSIYKHFFKLTCYVHYGFQTSSLLNIAYNLDTMNLCWKYFVSSKTDKNNSEKFSFTGSKNIVISGYPGLDPLISPRETSVNFDLGSRKLIIWAPHHTVEGVENLLHYSTFLDYYDYFIELSEKYKNEIIIAFKPHPVLITKLFKIWGIEKTHSYFEKWDNKENRLKIEGDYIDLFHISSALIHDSGSFIAEYLATRKPVMFLISNENIGEEFNSVGRESLKCHYQARTKKDIDNFIRSVVIDETDNMQNKRNDFFNKYLLSPNKKLASQNIFDYILEQIGSNE